MADLEKINNDIVALFRAGRDLLDKGNGACLNGCREEAFRNFEALKGVPYATEDYMYLDLREAFARDYHIPLKYIPQDIDIQKEFKCTVADLDTQLLLMVNGWYFTGNPQHELPEGVIICSMQEAERKYGDLLKKHYNQYAKAAEKDSLVSLNTAFAQDGIFIYVPDKVVLEKPLQIVNILRAQRNLMAFQRNLVVLGKQAKATILVCDHTLSEVDFLMNNATEIFLDDHADLDYYQVQNQHVATCQINSVFVSQQRNTLFEGNIVSLYGGLIRNNLFAALNKEGGNCVLNGVYILDKKQQIDNFVHVDHIAPHCQSNEHFKGVLDDASVGNFTGCIRVRPDAQKTEAYQANNNLLLTNTAKMNAKPRLVIDADDVKCSHGATVGQIDEEAMFYLRSRGISKEEARLMMMFGFAHDIVGRIRLLPLREEIDNMIDKRFRGEFSKCHNCILHCVKNEGC
ncbi:Fe-S cluster assembly protein SufD [Odoribacter sp. OttesenSCG-928-J03]|nr:Fe-S cluster assembly protein SufD [Odoribacter sp. OttesenSCG-928-J03]